MVVYLCGNVVFAGVVDAVTERFLRSFFCWGLHTDFVCHVPSLQYVRALVHQHVFLWPIIVVEPFLILAQDSGWEIDHGKYHQEESAHQGKV